MQPNLFGFFTLTLDTGSTITQSVDGDGGAAFFGWSDLAVTSFTMSILQVPDTTGELDQSFAFGRLVEGAGSPPPVGTPDGGSLFLLSGLLWTGMAGFKRWSKRV